MNFENWCNGEVSKSAKIFYVKNHLNISVFFSMKNNRLGAHFLLRGCFDNFKFKKPYY